MRSRSRFLSESTKFLAMILILVVWMTSCSQPVESASKNRSEVNPIKGKWKLVKRKFEPDTVFAITADTIEYSKIITDGTFIWYFYDKENKNVIAMAGGSYELKGGSYTEHIEFYHPPGQNMEGADIPFKCEVNGDEWLHSGFINDREYDEEIGDYVVIAERRLEEVWRRVE